MDTKRLIAISVITLTAASTVQAGDSVIFPEITSNYPKIIVAPPFHWDGFYLGWYLGGFSNPYIFNYSQEEMTEKWAWFDKTVSPKLSGVNVGFYLGSNIDLGNNLILSVDMDMVRPAKKSAKTDNKKEILDEIDQNSINTVFRVANIEALQLAHSKEDVPNIGDIVASSIILKEKWTGVTRIRIGFYSGRIMPYVSGGIAYANLQYIMSISSKPEDNPPPSQDKFPPSKEGDPSVVYGSSDILNERKTMIGYTIGGGFDFAITDNILFRTEYRYMDFGKKKFAEDELKINYKVNSFRFGFAWKF